MRDWGYEKVGFWLIRVRARDMIRVTIQIIKEMRNLKEHLSHETNKRSYWH